MAIRGRYLSRGKYKCHSSPSQQVQTTVGMSSSKNVVCCWAENKMLSQPHQKENEYCCEVPRFTFIFSLYFSLIFFHINIHYLLNRIGRRGVNQRMRHGSWKGYKKELSLKHKKLKCTSEQNRHQTPYRRVHADIYFLCFIRVEELNYLNNLSKT